MLNNCRIFFHFILFHGTLPVCLEWKYFPISLIRSVNINSWDEFSNCKCISNLASDSKIFDPATIITGYPILNLWIVEWEYINFQNYNRLTFYFPWAFSRSLGCFYHPTKSDHYQTFHTVRHTTSPPKHLTLPPPCCRSKVNVNLLFLELSKSMGRHSWMLYLCRNNTNFIRS